jgi:hypothetical protein
MALLINADGTEAEVFPANMQRGFTLKELYFLLDCDIVQAIQLRGPGISMLLDENAKLKNPVPPENPRATRLLHEAGGIPWDRVVGKALIVGRKEFH